MTYQAEWVRCGKNCNGCPHGPYWYGYWREGGRLHRKYMGKHSPFHDFGARSSEVHEDDIFSRRKGSLTLALQILGLSVLPTIDELVLVYRRLARETHPDSGGDAREFARISAAYSYVKACIG